MPDKTLMIPRGGGAGLKIKLVDQGDGTFAIATSGGGGGGGGGGAATIANGADVTQGAIADAAYTTGSGTLVSLLKGIFGKANTIDSTQGTTGDASWDGSASTATEMAYLRRSASTQGLPADTAWVSGSGSVVALLKNVAGAVASVGAVADAAWTTGNGTLVAVLKAIAGSNNTVAGAVATARMNTRLQRDGVATALTIAISTTDTGAWDISGWITGGFILPSAFTGTAVSFKVSQTTTGHQPLYDSTGTLISITAAANRAFPIPPEAAGFNSIIITSNASESAARTINTWKKG